MVSLVQKRKTLAEGVFFGMFLNLGEIRRFYGRWSLCFPPCFSLCGVCEMEMTKTNGSDSYTTLSKPVGIVTWLK